MKRAAGKESAAGKPQQAGMRERRRRREGGKEGKVKNLSYFC